MKLKSPLLILFVTIFIDFLGFGILVPIIPSLFTLPDSPSYLLSAGTSIETGYILMGLLLAIFFIGQFFISPILGELSDRYGRKKVLIGSVLGSAVSFFIFGLGVTTLNIVLVFIGRTINAFTSSIIAVSQASIADITAPAERTKNFGLIGAAFGAGFVFGPFLGGTLSNSNLVSWFGPSTPFWVASTLSLVNVIFLALFFRETSTHRTRQTITITHAFKNIRKAFHMRELRMLFTTNFFYQIGWNFFITFFSVFLIIRYGFSQQAIGNYFAYVGIWIVISQGFLLRRVPSHIKSEDILRWSILATSVCLILQFFTNSWIELLFIIPLLAIANGFSLANMPSMISKMASPEKQGEIMGLNTSVESLARAIPPLISGFIAATISPSSPLIISSFLVFIAWVIFVTRSTQKNSSLSLSSNKL